MAVRAFALAVIAGCILSCGLCLTAFVLFLGSDPGSPYTGRMGLGALAFASCAAGLVWALGGER